MTTPVHAAGCQCGCCTNTCPRPGDHVTTWKAQARVKLIEAIVENARRGDFEAVRQDAVIGRAIFQPVPAQRIEDEDPTAGFTYPSDR